MSVKLIPVIQVELDLSAARVKAACAEINVRRQLNASNKGRRDKNVNKCKWQQRGQMKH